MTEEVRKLKSLRKNKLTAFTRKKNTLQKLLDENPSADRLKEVLDEVKDAFCALETAHDKYAAEVEEEGDFLESPSSSLETLKSGVASRIEQLDKEEKFRDAKKQLEHQINTFGSPSRCLVSLALLKTSV